MQRPALLTQVLAVNALIITGTVFAISLAARLSDVVDERRLAVLVAALMAMLLLNGLLLRRRFAPLAHMIEAMEAADLSGAEPRVTLPAAELDEVARLHDAFEAMLTRLRAERARSAAAVIAAQEGERARLARDLHDEANQALTGVLLRLEATAQRVSPELRDELRETQRVATQAITELLRLARELRPAALDDHGLGPALRSQVEEFARRARVPAKLHVGERALDDLDADAQIVVYRIVQESLLNIARHAGARNVDVDVRCDRSDGMVRVRVADDGAGFDALHPSEGLGLTGMRERAALAGGRIDVRSAPGGGTAVELRLGTAACAS